MLRLLPRFIAGCIGNISTSTAQAPGTFAKAGSLAVSRSLRSDDGQPFNVLLVGRTQ